MDFTQLVQLIGILKIFMCHILEYLKKQVILLLSKTKKLIEIKFGLQFVTLKMKKRLRVLL
jgi:hypothetical protein